MICYQCSLFYVCIIQKKKKILIQRGTFIIPIASELTEWSIVELAIPTAIPTSLRVLEPLEISLKFGKVT